jgi:hypothetical protein
MVVAVVAVVLVVQVEPAVLVQFFYIIKGILCKLFIQ